MANKNRITNRYLSDLSLSDEPLFQQSFEGLLRYVDANAELHERLGHSLTVKQEPLRLGQAPLLHFHSSAFTSLIQKPQTQHFKLSNAYFGLFGINGALPSHLTEHAIQRKNKHKDTTLIEFCDLFHHRFISLFYRAWADSQPALSHDFAYSNSRSTHSKYDIFASRIAVFTGSRSTKPSSNRKALATKTDNSTPTDNPTPTNNHNSINNQHVDTSSLYFAGLLSMKNKSAGMVRQVVEEFLQLPVKIHQFEGRWFDIPNTQYSRLSGNNALLSSTAVLGTTTFQRSFNFSIDIGPIGFDDYMQFLKDPLKVKQLRKLIHRITGSEYDLNFRVTLAAKQKQQTHLGKASLAINSWICSKPDTHSKAHVAFTL